MKIMETTKHLPSSKSDAIPSQVKFTPLHQKSAPAPSVITRIGYYSCSVLVIGSLIIIAGFTYVSFLWWSRAGLRSQIVLNTWVATSVTIASLAIRTSIAFQAIVCTAMVAALALRWHQVGVAESAAMSLFRFANAGPSSLLFTLVKSGKTKVPGAGLLILCLTIVALSSNAISSALVSDLNIAIIPGHVSSDTPAFGVNVTRKRFRHFNYDNKPLTHQRRPDQYPSFAEQTLYDGIKSERIHDTGVVLRAFLPIKSTDDRSQVRYYNGTAAGLMMRTICVRPQIMISNITLLGEIYEMVGNVSADPDQGWSEFFEPTQIQFDCIFDVKSEINVCQFPASANSTPLSTDSTNFGMRYMSEFTGSSSQRFRTTYLVWNSTVPIQNQHDENEWVYMESKAYNIGGNKTRLFNGLFTMCTAITLDNYMYISASRPANISEPSLEWIRSVDDQSEERINTAPILKQLGVGSSNPTLPERGLLSLDSRDQPEAPDAYFKISKITLESESEVDELYEFQWALFYQGVTTNWTYAYDWKGQGFDNYLYSIAIDALTSTNHPASMLQAVNTIIYSMAYYNEYIAFDLYDLSAQIQYFVQALQPVKSRGYWAVAAIIVCHFLLTSVITILYISGGGDGDILGQSWVAVNQLKSEEVKLIRQNDAVMDSDVKRLLKRNGLAYRKVGLVDCGEEHVIRSLRE